MIKSCCWLAWQEPARRASILQQEYLQSFWRLGTNHIFISLLNDNWIINYYFGVPTHNSVWVFIVKHFLHDLVERHLDFLDMHLKLKTFLKPSSSSVTGRDGNTMKSCCFIGSSCFNNVAGILLRRWISHSQPFFFFLPLLLHNCDRSLDVSFTF